MADRDEIPLRSESHGEDVEGTPVATIVFTGDLDLSSVETFRAAVTPEAMAGADAVIVDLSAVRFVDSSGIHALLSTWKALTASGVGTAVVVESGSNIERVLSMTGLLKEIRPVPDRPAALAAITEGS